MAADVTGASLPTPEPVPDAVAYERERELALAFSPLRKENYKRYMASHRRAATVDYLPIRLDIENVSRCNFRCTMCQVSDWHKGTRAADMSLADFKSLIDQQYGLVEIKLQGFGEPLMQGDDFFEMIRYARAQHIWVRTTTNASLLHLKKNYQKLIDSGVNEVQISIDGSNKKTYENIRRGAVYERVIENCKLINRYCDEIGVVRTKMWTVVQRVNADEMQSLVRLAHEIGFKIMVFSLNLIDFGNEEWKTKNDSVSVESSFDDTEGFRLIELGKSLGVQVRFWRQLSKYDVSSPGTLCPWPFERGYVSSDMRAVPCCMVGNPEVADLGGAKDFTLSWTGPIWEAFRQSHLSGKIPHYCQSCYRQQKK